MSFLCRWSDEGPFLHVHDSPSYYADVMRHVEMGWRVADTCQHPGNKASDGDPGVKPFQVLDVTVHAPHTDQGRDDHHTLLVLGDNDFNKAQALIKQAHEEGRDIIGYGDYVPHDLKFISPTKPGFSHYIPGNSETR